MKILHVNKFLYRRGGAESYLLDLAALQADSGDSVSFFATRHPRNEPSAHERRFPEYLELNPPPASWPTRAKAAARVFYSRVAETGLAQTVDDVRPDVVHVHNIYHHLSPSVLRPLEERGIPTVMTLHDFKLACPTHRFMANGTVCEACVPRRFHMAAVKRCHQGSLAASALNGLELAIHTALHMYGPVKLFLCPSRFLEEKMRASRVFPERLRWLPNFVDVAAIESKGAPGGGVVYAGRLSEEKGVETLVRAAARLPCDVHVAGEGPERDRLERLAVSVGARNVVFHGHVPREEVHRLVRAAAVAVMPSRGYENAPMGILEAFACGVPVVGTAHGGIPELIDAGVDGELVPPGDDDELGATLARLVADPAGTWEMGRVARRKVEERFTPEAHLDRLRQLYEEAALLATGRS